MMRNRVRPRAAARWRFRLLSGVAVHAMVINTLAPLAAVAADTGANDGNTQTPIKHVIVIIGENRTFDHMFATYQPVDSNQTVLNLLSEGIVNPDGTPGPNYAKAATQYQAIDTAAVQKRYLLSPPKTGPYSSLPAPLAGGGPPPFTTIADAQTYENGLPPGYYKYLTTGGLPSGLDGKPDTRIYYNGRDVNNLAPGPYQITNDKTGNPRGPVMTDDDYAESPVHRFYQMWQQLDCSAAAGCQNDLFAWVEATVGAGSNGKPPPAGFTYKEGATALGFYNVQQGDLPYFKYLADTYSMSDNYHQAVNGGTGANHIMLCTGDAIWFSDGRGNPKRPPHNQLVAAGSPNAGVVDEIENPNPRKGTNNWYSEDGYGGGSYGSASYGGGSYTECANPSAPGVKTITDYLRSVNVRPNCEPGRYYLLNNYNPGYYGDGTNAYDDIKNPYNTVFTVPPSKVRNIGDALLKKNVTFAWFGDQFNAYLANPYNNYVTPDNTYCNICNFFQYSTSIMTDAAVRKMALQDTLDLYHDLMSCTDKSCSLPAVSFVKPDGYLDGHPASSKPDLLAGFIKKIVDLTRAHSTLWNNTAIFITMDEGGGYYDSGYVQPLDYFGDGTRIPMIVVSKYSRGGHISHTYSDHVSILKFIEANWQVPPITKRSRDNLPNPKSNAADPYKPINRPAIGDLMDLFSFKS
jgi:phospholipase C